MSLRTKSGLFLIALMAICVSGLWAFQWPVDSRVLTATFGESRWDHFHTGIDIGGGAQKVRPVESGEVVYYQDGAAREGTPPSGLGTFLVIEHERGIRSLYAHLEPGSVSELPPHVGLDTVIGTIGDTGASLGKHLHLEIIDSEIGSYVNPLLVLPSLPDTVTPDIKSVRYVSDDADEETQPVPLVRGARVPSGEHRLLIELYDRSEYVAYFCPMSPYRITGFINGSEAFDFTMDSLSEKNGELVIGRGNATTSFADLYHDDWVVESGPIPFRVGEIQLEIVARDLVGNEASLRIPVTVQ